MPTAPDRSTMDRAAVARAAADRLGSLTTAEIESVPALIGFDGFIDSIIHVVDQRHAMTPDGYSRIATIDAFAARVAAAAGKSANLELVTIEERFGGNGPLFAGALGQLGMPTTYVGAVGAADGTNRLHPIFQGFAQRCRRVIPVGPPAFTDALEFDDGKLMLNKPGNIQNVSWELLTRAIGLETLRSMIAGTALIGIVNWTLMGGVNSVWQGLKRDILGGLPRTTPSGRRRSIFIDLTDPAKRTDHDLAAGLTLLSDLNTVTPVTLGLNLAEAERVARVIGVETSTTTTAPSARLIQMARAIRATLALDAVVIHPREGAAAATAAGESVWFDGPFTNSPRLSTGAGDHFNGGFSYASSLGLPLAECLAVGCAVSGAYVRDTTSPTRGRLVEFLRNLPEPES